LRQAHERGLAAVARPARISAPPPGSGDALPCTALHCDAARNSGHARCAYPYG